MSEQHAPPTPDPTLRPEGRRPGRAEARVAGALLLIEVVLAVLAAAFMLLWVLKADPHTGVRSLEVDEGFAVGAFLAVAIWAGFCWWRLRRGRATAAVVYGAVTTAFFLVGLADPSADLLMPLAMQGAILLTAWRARRDLREPAVPRGEH